MRRFLVLPALALATLSFASDVGDKAPMLKVEAVVKGKAVAMDRGVHVLAFFATWYKPSVDVVPLLTDLAHKYKGKVDFTGVSVNERGDDPLPAVKKFVADMGPKMDYNVAFDGDLKAMETNYLQAFGPVAPPAAFLVQDGKVLWIGAPTDGLDEAIDQTLKGKFDLAASRAAFEKQMTEAAAAEKQQIEVSKMLAPVRDAMAKGDVDGALAELDKVESAPTTAGDLKKEFAQLHFRIVLGTGKPLSPLAKRYLEVYKGDAETLNSLAWMVVDPEEKWQSPDLASAVLLAAQAAQASDMKDGMILDTYALTLYKTGERTKAVELQTKAVELSKTDKRVDAKTLKEMQGRLEQFKKSNV